MAYEKPIPKRGTHTGPFWDGAKEGKLMLPRCRDCNRVHWYPRFLCPFCHSNNLEWFEGNFESYEEDKIRRLGPDSVEPKRVKYKKFTR